MKLFSLLFAALMGMAVLAPATASASPFGGSRTRVTYDHTGCRVFWVYTCVGHDRHGCAIYRWVIQSRSHGHGGHGGHGGYDRGYSHGGGHYGHGDGRHGSRRGGGGGGHRGHRVTAID